MKTLLEKTLAILVLCLPMSAEAGSRGEGGKLFWLMVFCLGLWFVIFKLFEKKKRKGRKDDRRPGGR